MFDTPRDRFLVAGGASAASSRQIIGESIPEQHQAFH
jgi:hypothetical protein